jgi:hypothetical protein
VPGFADKVGPAEAEYRPLLFSIAYGMTGSVGDRRSGGVPDHGGDAAGNQLPAFGADAAGDLRERLAA